MRLINCLLLAFFLIGCTSVFGQDEIKFTPELVEEVTRLAEEGNAEAQYNLGLSYYNGEGVPKDHQQAFKWFRRSAEQGLADAQTSLGLMYVRGQGVPQDYQEALKWLRRAAEQGYANAQDNLGNMYFLGMGVPKDYVLAYKWVNLAAAQGNKSSAELRDFLATKMNTSQIQETQRLAREFKPKKE